MAVDDYDKYDTRYPSKKRSIFKFLKRGQTDSQDYIIFKCASVAWVGTLDGKVDRNPICIDCETQLSFIDSDTIICDTCHKYQNKDGEFYFTIDDQKVTFDEAYQAAQKRWQQILKDRQTY